MRTDVNILKNMYCDYMTISTEKQEIFQKRRPALPKISRKLIALPSLYTACGFDLTDFI